MAEKQITEKQHYVPQVYLQGFSQDGINVYEYNFKKAAPIPNAVPIESVCREKYLYEVRNRSGEIINTNYIENFLCSFEGDFAEYRRKLLRKAIHKENFQTRSFLTKEEKAFWTFYTSLQIVRHPITLSAVKAIIQDETNGYFSEQDAHNLAIALSLPFFKEPNEQELNPMLFFVSMLRTKAIGVAYVAADNLFTSDHAVYGSRRPEDEFYQFERLWFPISSNCALIFSNPETIDRTMRNRLITVTDDEVRNLNKGIAYIAAQMVISKHPFSEEDIRLIEEARRERAQDEEQKEQNSII